MTIKKYVLMVDAPDGALAASARQLEELYEVARVGDLAQALVAVAQLQRLSLVVVHCRSGADPGGYEPFMASVRALHPGLPVLWVGDTGDLVASFLKQPGATERDVSVEAVKRRAVKLLHDEFYRSDIVQDVTDAAAEVLLEFGAGATRSDPYIKSSLTSLGEVNALLGFSGEGLSGHLVLSASLEAARKLHRAVVPRPSAPEYDDLEDLLGEIANRVLGAVKRVFEARSLSFRLRTPVFIRGLEASYRSKGAAPSLAIEFTDESGLLRLELCIDRMRGDPAARAADAAFLEAGQITFL